MKRSVLSGARAAIRTAVVTAVAASVAITIPPGTVGAVGLPHGGMRATIDDSLGSCQLQIQATWPHARPGQSSAEIGFVDDTTSSGFFEGHGIDPAATSLVDVRTFSSFGSSDSWHEDMTLYNADGRALAHAISPEGSFECRFVSE